MGLKQPIRSWNLTDRRETAYHEAGHAVAARLRPSYRISKATIIRRGHALGVQQKPLEERTSMYARWIETQIMVSLAGHVVEAVPGRLGGPSSDLQSATNSAISTCAVRDGPDQAHRAAPARAVPPPRSWSRRTRCSTTCTPRRSACFARRSRRSPPGQGPDRAGRADRRRARRGVPEVERAHPELTDKFERKVIPFRDFAPPERQVVGPGPRRLPSHRDAAASDAPAASEPLVASGPSAIGGPGYRRAGASASRPELDAAGVAGWLPPLSGSSRDRNRGSDGPGMPTTRDPPGRPRRSITDPGRRGPRRVPRRAAPGPPTRSPSGRSTPGVCDTDARRE